MKNYYILMVWMTAPFVFLIPEPDSETWWAIGQEFMKKELGCYPGQIAFPNIPGC